MSYLGWAGFLLYLLAQVLLARGLIDGPRYVLLNCFASSMVAIYSLYIDSLQPFFISVIWSIISLLAVYLRLPARQPDEFTSREGMHPMETALVISTIGFLVLVSQIHIEWPAALSWLSLLLYSGAYVGFVFFALHVRRFFILCTFAAASIIPDLVMTANYPTLSLHLAWGLTSLWGYMRLRAGDVSGSKK